MVNVIFIAFTAISIPILAFNDSGVNSKEKSRNVNYSCQQYNAMYQTVLDNVLVKDDFIVNEVPKLPEEIIKDSSGDRVEPMKHDSQGWLYGWKGEPASADLILSWYNNRSSFTECLKESNTLKNFKVVIREKADRLLKEAAGGRTGPFFVTLSKPVLDKSGTHALIATYRRGNGLGARSEFIHMKKQSTGWEMVGARVGDIS